MLRDPDRLRALLLDPKRPVQFVIAGKAHPADDAGKRLIQEIVRFADDPEIRHRIVFLPGYDMALATVLCAGADVWLNNPLRPLEACGTSGMKAALNGALNLSIRDGWWDEWFDGDNGWAIPSADQAGDDQRDDLEAAALYDLLQNQILPRFYDHDGHDLPSRWLEMVRHTFASLGPKVVATRMVREYVTSLYTPAAQSHRRIEADDFAGARHLASWRAGVEAAWHGVRVEHVEASSGNHDLALGGDLGVRAIVTLGTLTPDDVDVQAVSGVVGERDEITEPAFTPLQLCEGPDGDRRAVYEGDIPLDRTGPFGYSVRVLPRDPMLSSGAELGLIAIPEAPEGMVTGDLR
jgi:starch phosphorylase